MQDTTLRSPLALRLAAAWPPADWQDVTVVLAVSGGADSLALLVAMCELKPGGAAGIVAAHLNHHLRGAASDEDEAFVRDVCKELGVTCVVGHVEAGFSGLELGDGLEAAAREARYEFLLHTAYQYGARYVATAHTADDQAETVLHRIVRGTGIAGLAGIPRARALGPDVTLIRPFLTFRREDLREDLRLQRRAWREDATNQLLHHTRNRIRLDLLPRLAQDYNPDAADALLRLSSLAAEAQAVIDEAATAILDAALVSALENEVILATTPLQDQRPYLLCEAFLALWRRQGWPRGRMTQDDWRRLADLARAAPGAVALTLPGDIDARRVQDCLILATNARRVR